MEDQVERCLGEGVKGLDELYHLSKSGEMIIQTPLQDAVGLVLSALEKNSFGLTESNIAYVLKAGDFISTMMHWTETEHVIRENYDKLICVAFRALMTPDAVAWAPIYTTVLTRLNSIDRDKCQQFLSRVRSNFHFLASIRAVAADEGWMRMQHRAKFVNEILQAPLTSS